VSASCFIFIIFPRLTLRISHAFRSNKLCQLKFVFMNLTFSQALINFRNSLKWLWRKVRYMRGTASSSTLIKKRCLFVLLLLAIVANTETLELFRLSDDVSNDFTVKSAQPTSVQASRIERILPVSMNRSLAVPLEKSFLVRPVPIAPAGPGQDMLVLFSVHRI
jgi:hypothetical protein